MKHCIFLFLLLISSGRIIAAEQFIRFEANESALQLNTGNIINMYISPTDERGVMRAARTVLSDLVGVCGSDTVLTAQPEDATIVVGTLGHCQALNKLLSRQQINTIRGHREQFLITTVGRQLVIAGSDRRGTIYGLYELARQAGVSPWNWWADVAVEPHNEIYAMSGEYTDGEPVVQWRGIFLNDEAPCLTTWVRNTFGTNYGGHEFYGKVFELILRLRGNFLWPAMWSWAFYADDPENSRLADEMGVIIGTSHHEPMARNHQEYARRRGDWGPWNYATNSERLDEFFRQGIERIKDTEDVVTIGMRGDGDEAMSAEADTRLLEQVVAHQRQIIREVTGRPADKTPQVWALYKEVLDYYDAGMRVPDDVCILLCDDNWGNIRRVPTAQERRHKGGWGIYYHVDYVGAPRNTKWINVTQTQSMWEQLHLAADFGLDRMWILNVGDLKPMEYQIQLFLDMAWDPQHYDGTAIVQQHTEPFCASVVGEQYAREAARLLDTSARFNSRVTAEMLDADTYNLTTGEWDRVCGEFARLEADALQLYRELPEQKRTAYHELILFPIQAMANLYEMYRAVAMNRALAAIGNSEANLWAENARQRFHRDSLLCDEYNTRIANGKWRGMMIQKHIGYSSWNDNFRHETLPALATVPEGSRRQAPYTSTRGYISIEADHYTTASAGSASGTVSPSWTTYLGMGRTHAGVALTPYSVEPQGASLSYSIQLPAGTDNVSIHVIVKSTLDFLNRGGHKYTVAIDGAQPQEVNFNANLNEAPANIYSVFYPTVARRVVENTVTLPVAATTDNIHTVTISPLTPGIVFEKLIIDFGGYTPQYLFGQEEM